jgi:lipopolysaccharide transport system ATP-binding protein
MASDVVLKVKDLSKQYRLGTIGTGTLSDDLNRWWHIIRGKEDPYLKIGEENNRAKKGETNYVWSLRDISFEVRRGEVLGVIGKNGAGKSTLLKILSKVTSPTTGEINYNGRIASLLEVGTGFHAELTGKENVFLNGAILGMTKAEIGSKLDEIIEFSGCERYIDTPVKRYSSGMTVRLAFAVAAFLEPDILIVDEVLAVGDVEFQKKAIGKMKEISSGDNGRTVLFVSHNMATISALTNRCIYLKDGKIHKIANTEDVVEYYYKDNNQNDIRDNSSFINTQINEDKPIQLLDAKLNKKIEVIEVDINYIVNKNIGSVVAVKLVTSREVVVLTIKDDDINRDVFSKEVGKYNIKFNLPSGILSPDTYRVTISFSDMKTERFDYHSDVLSFEVNEVNSKVNLSNKTREGVLLPQKEYIGQSIQMK